MRPRIEVVEREDRVYWIINCGIHDLNSFAQVSYTKLESLLVKWINREGAIFVTSSFYLRFRVNQESRTISNSSFLLRDYFSRD